MEQTSWAAEAFPKKVVWPASNQRTAAPKPPSIRPRSPRSIKDSSAILKLLRVGLKALEILDCYNLRPFEVRWRSPRPKQLLDAAHSSEKIKLG